MILTKKHDMWVARTNGKSISAGKTVDQAIINAKITLTRRRKVDEAVFTTTTGELT